jgi:hypothetical protein
MAISVEVALSLTQPWATLVAIGAKRRETRCWPTRYRGWIAIHAAKGFPRDCQYLCDCEPFHRVLLAGGYTHASELPRGQLIAVACLHDCIATSLWAPPRESDERAFGDYSPTDSGNGKPRYSFGFQTVRRLRAPFDCKGALGIWRLPRAITERDLLEEGWRPTRPIAEADLFEEGGAC